MTKEALFGFLKDLACWIIVIIILQLAAHRTGWTDSSIKDNIIGLTVGWLLWKAVMLALHRKSD